MQLSKSDYMLFLRHPAWLWLKKHDKGKLPPIEDSLQALFDGGHLFESYAEKLFIDPVRIGFSFEEKNYMSMPERTSRAITEDAQIIFQGRLESGELTCIFDVIKRVDKNQYDLYEIKASAEVKDEHILDLAFQTIVLEDSGLSVRKLYVIYANTEYKRNGEIDVNQITNIAEVTDRVRNSIEETRESIQKALQVMHSKTPPSFSPRYVGLGELKDWMAIYEILFPHTHSHNIYELTRVNPKLIGILEDLGIKHIADIPDTVKLNDKQKKQVAVTKGNKRIVDREQIKKFLDQITYPLYFLDYETYNSVIPPFDKTHPYQQIPFQYSLHILDKPHGTLTHKEFIHTENSNPDLPLLKQLEKNIGNQGSIFVWYQSFEKGRNTELGEMYPEYAQFTSNLNERVIDLMTPFAQNWFDDKDFLGSASIKKVLPVLIPELSYKELEIQEGGTASRVWGKTVIKGKNLENKDTVIKNLLEYCSLDTLAMVEVFRLLLQTIA